MVFHNYRMQKYNQKKQGEEQLLELPILHSQQPEHTTKQYINISNRYLVLQFVNKYPTYNHYLGLDANEAKHVNIYIKVAVCLNQSTQTGDTSFGKHIKEQLKNKVASATLWQGQQKIGKNLYDIQVHEKLGPSLAIVRVHFKKELSQKNILHLLYYLIKLTEKLNSLSIVYRQLSLQNIVCDKNPEKNDLYVLNLFPAKKRKEEAMSIDSKYCSRSSHLGISANSKDDLESICYIIIDFWTRGNFLDQIPKKKYEVAKSSLNIHHIQPTLPPLFFDFYTYVINLPRTQQINYFYWKNAIQKAVGKQTITRPYQWISGALAYCSQESSINSLSNPSLSIKDGKTLGSKIPPSKFSEKTYEISEEENDDNFEENVGINKLYSKVSAKVFEPFRHFRNL